MSLPTREVMEHMAAARGCVGPFPCGVKVGAYDRDLPCMCEESAQATRTFVSEPTIVLVTLTPGDRYYVADDGTVLNAHGSYLGTFQGDE